MIAVTGVSGQLGRLVIENLLESDDPSTLVAIVRNPEKVQDLADRGVLIRKADYNDKPALQDALSGVEKLLLISSSEVGQRVPQHANVIDAAQRAGVGFIAYTSILHADTSPMSLAVEHRETERAIAESGIPHVLLRNGWYTENYAASIPSALEHGVMLGAAGDGKISSAARADYAAAAAAVLLAENPSGTVYELAGDQAYTLEAFAAQIGSQSGKDIRYENLPEVEFKAALAAAGLPEAVAQLLSESDTGVSRGGLFDDSGTLSRLIGRPTTSFQDVIKTALAQS